MSDTSEFVIRPAQPSEAQDVFALKQRSFADSTLPFTIYRAPASIRHLERLIRTMGDDGAERISVAVAGKVIGYYLSSIHVDTCFLNYIAVDPDCHGLGIGRALLADFEARARRGGFLRLELDAIQNNESVIHWYQIQGYSQVGTRNHLRLGVALPNSPAPRLWWDETAWAAAIAEEAEWGFSKLEAFVERGNVKIGLIDGAVCKLLSWNGLDLVHAIDAVMRAVAGTRTELIVSNLSAVPAELSYLQRLEVIRLVKALQRV